MRTSPSRIPLLVRTALRATFLRLTKLTSLGTTTNLLELPTIMQSDGAMEIKLSGKIHLEFNHTVDNDVVSRYVSRYKLILLNLSTVYSSKAAVVWSAPLSVRFEEGEMQVSANGATAKYSKEDGLQGESPPPDAESV